MTNPDDIGTRLADAIEAAANAHDSGDLRNIDDGYDELEPIAFGHEDPDVRLAMSFWDGWVDSRNHDWLFYEPITESDWPQFARHVASSLRSGTPISDPVVVKRFEELPPLRERLKARFKRK